MSVTHKSMNPVGHGHGVHVCQGMFTVFPGWISGSAAPGSCDKYFPRESHNRPLIHKSRKKTLLKKAFHAHAVMRNVRNGQFNVAAEKLSF